MRIFGNFHISHIITLFGLWLAVVHGSEIELSTHLVASTNLTAARLIHGIDANRHWKPETLIAHQGYEVEVHSVGTQDGYTLTLHRLPQPGYQPVLLVHGLYGSATDFLLMGRNISLAYQLWDQHYDVWLANCRGAPGSQNHTHHTRHEVLFWNFSFHDIGFFDLPAMMDYIRSNTSYHAMHYVGHSQGATALLVLASLRPQYNERLAKVHLMAPLVYVGNTQLDQVHLDIIRDFLKDPCSRELCEFSPHSFLDQLNCLKNKFLQFSCLQIIFQIVGHDIEQFERSKLELILNQWPSSGSVKQLRHYYQLYTSKAFHQYNYDFEGNYDKYGQPTAPKYDLSNITTSIFIHYGFNDRLVNPLDIKILHNELLGLTDQNIISYKHFNHMDFIWSKNLQKTVNQNILKTFGLE